MTHITGICKHLCSGFAVGADNVEVSRMDMFLHLGHSLWGKVDTECMLIGKAVTKGKGTTTGQRRPQEWVTLFMD